VVKKADDAVEAAAKKADDVSSSVYHVKSNEFAQSVLDDIEPKYFGKDNRFEDGFYVAQKGETAIAEVSHHGGDMANSKVIRFGMDESKLKTLDLTDPKNVKAWEYDKALEYEQKVEKLGKNSLQNKYKKSIELSQKARKQGYNSIKFPSKRGAEGATNMVIYHTDEVPVNSVFSPEMVMPATK
jgi:hypothetical protein